MIRAGQLQRLGHRRLSTMLKPPSKPVAVVLSGSGGVPNVQCSRTFTDATHVVYDGSEITEAVSVYIHLSRKGIPYETFAPDENQMHVVNHLTGQVTGDTRNVLVESARIARGKIKPLSELAQEANKYSAVLFPGGFGAAKNLCSWAVDGPNMKVHPTVEKVVHEFQSLKKPIGLCCISPVIAAKLIEGVTVTVGMEEGPQWPYAATAKGIEEMGAHHDECDILEACVDVQNMCVTSAAYMKDAPPHEVFESVSAMINGVLHLVNEQSP